MNNKVVSIVVAVLVTLGLASGVYFMVGSPSKTELQVDQAIQIDTQEQAETDSANVTEPSKSTSLKILLASGQPQRCQFIDSTDPFKTQGTVFINGGKVRGDLMSTRDSKIMKFHMIGDMETNYVWVEGMTTGAKSTVKSSSAVPGDDKWQGIDNDKEADYRCDPWIVDSSLFVLPTNIEFIDMSRPIIDQGPIGLPNNN
ncbi:MAG: hypothetical protein WC052_01350 [Patescibacteria group bacterium]|jgi:hypothetical protein